MSKQSLCQQSHRTSPSPSNSSYSSYLKPEISKPSEYPLIFPPWLVQRNDFQDIYREFESLEKLDLIPIFQKDSRLRKESENDAIDIFIENCFFFGNIFNPASLIRKFVVEIYEPGENLYNETDKKVHIILSGEVLLDGELRLARLNSIGELQITEGKNINALATQRTSVLSISEEDYRTLFMHCRIKQNRQIVPILQKVSFFEDVKQLRIEKIGAVGISMQFEKNEEIYHIGSKACYFYLVLEGRVEVSSEIKLKSINDLPIGFKNREKLVVERQYFHPVATIGENDWFAIPDAANNTKRRTTARTSKRTVLFAVKWADVLEIVNDQERKSIMNKVHAVFDGFSLKNMLANKIAGHKKHISALMQAGGVNFTPYGRDTFRGTTQRKRMLLQKLSFKNDEYANENLVSK